MRYRVSVALATLFFNIGLTQAESSEPIALEAIEIEAQPIFTGEQLEERRIFRWVHRFHKTTTPDTIRRVLWKVEGQVVDASEVLEFEREIRGLGVFSDVDVRVEAGATLKIVTRDRVSLYPAIVPFSVGGVSGFAALVVEENLFGKADELFIATANNSDGERESRISFTDRHLFGLTTQLGVFVGSTEEGDSFGASLSKPFRHLQDDWSWSTSASDREERIDFYDLGESVAEVPQQTSLAEFSIARAYGDVESRNQFSFGVRHDDTNFGTAFGPQAGTIVVPGDLKRTTFSLFHKLRHATHYVVETNFDRLGVDEDLALGLTLDSGIAGTHRREVGVANRWEPGAFLGVSWASKIGRSSYLTLRSTGAARYFEGDARGWQKGIELHYFDTRYRNQIIALNVTFDEVQELDDLPPQLTLGEDNGLRGYPARQFSGRKRLRVNVEDRIDFNREFFTFRVGGVAFFDAGWVGDDSLGSVRTSVGLGLRFGSPEITGGRILRLDVAYPLNERSGEDFGPTVSFAVGQVFDFFGSNSSLSNR